MKKKIVFIDESGDTGYTKKSTRYFIITAVITDDDVLLRRIVKNIHRSKSNKKKGNILHAYKETDVIKSKITRKLIENNIKCLVFTIDKTRYFIDDVYRYALENILYLFKSYDIEHVIIAKRDPRKYYNNNLINIYEKNNLKLKFTNHTNDISLQIADFYSWVTFVYLEKDETKYFLQLEKLITIIKAKPSQGLLAIM